MDVLEEIKSRLGLSFEDLKSAERDTLMGWLNALDKQQVTPESILSYVSRLRQIVDTELATHKLSAKEDLYLKARLKNYILLEAFLRGPAEAKKAIEMYVKRLKK
jgi:hypothetical protein